MSEVIEENDQCFCYGSDRVCPIHDADANPYVSKG